MEVHITIWNMMANDIENFRTMTNTRVLEVKVLWESIANFFIAFSKNNSANCDIVKSWVSLIVKGIGTGFSGSDSLALVSCWCWPSFQYVLLTSFAVFPVVEQRRGNSRMRGSSFPRYLHCRVR